MGQPVSKGEQKVDIEVNVLGNPLQQEKVKPAEPIVHKVDLGIQLPQQQEKEKPQ